MIGIESELFGPARLEFDKSLQGLLNYMIDRRLVSGDISLKCGIELALQQVTNQDTGEVETAMIPRLTYKVSIATSSGASCKGIYSNSKKAIVQDGDGNFQYKEIFDGQESLFEEEKEDEEQSGEG